MLVWKEAHPVLSTIFDIGHKTLDFRLLEYHKRVEEERLAEEELLAERERLAKEQQKEKSLLKRISETLGKLGSIFK